MSVSPPKFWRTQSPEEAVRALAECHRHVMVNNSVVSRKRIPLRRNKLADLDWYHYKRWSSIGQNQLEMWLEDGGLLMDGTPTIERAPDWFEMGVRCGGYYFVECPLDRSLVDRWSAPCTGDVVLHQPPTWDNHKESSSHIQPGEDVLLRVADACIKLAAQPRTDKERQIAKLLGIETESFASFTWPEMSAMTGIHESEGPGVLKHLQRRLGGPKTYFPDIYVFIPRYPPPDPFLRAVYDVFDAQPPVNGNERLATGTMIAKAAYSFMPVLRRLNAEGFGERKRTIRTVLVEPGRRVLPGIIQSRSKKAATGVEELIRWCESLPVFPTR